MNEPLTFTSATTRIGLPLLFAGQSQKEFFVNQALGILDALHCRAVVASRSGPPEAAEEGDCFRVTAPAAGSWAGREDHLAVRIAGAWHFIVPRTGMMLFDATAGSIRVFREGWVKADAPASPAGGTTIDSEARATIGELVDRLKAIGILA